MHEVGAVVGDGGSHPPAGQGDAHLRIAGQRQGGDPHHRAGRVRVVPGGYGRGYDERFMAAGGEVPCGLQGAVRHTVDVGGKGFGDDDDTHTGVVVAPGVARPTWIFPPVERPMSVWARAACAPGWVVRFPRPCGRSPRGHVSAPARFVLPDPYTAAPAGPVRPIRTPLLRPGPYA
ncbi:hypothetical protein GCM10014713_46460 [Streptomyces purpureus]|uniref:Uncharacterized protein n=1 Tax=Streptomyces purpureus TaxID=1951 RepID=A0A918H9Z4_9ACTN|nr:hypothetical protein GCM10014713_46460 [Streptomyces purpureus]